MIKNEGIFYWKCFLLNHSGVFNRTGETYWMYSLLWEIPYHTYLQLDHKKVVWTSVNKLLHIVLIEICIQFGNEIAWFLLPTSSMLDGCQLLSIKLVGSMPYAITHHIYSIRWSYFPFRCSHLHYSWFRVFDLMP